jgi:hypothetical protein
MPRTLSLVHTPWRSGSPHGVFGGVHVLAAALAGCLAGVWAAAGAIAADTSAAAAVAASQSVLIAVSFIKAHTL